MQSLIYTITEIECLEIQITNTFASKSKKKTSLSTSAYKNFKQKVLERVKEVGLQNIDDETIERLLFLKDRETILTTIKNNHTPTNEKIYRHTTIH